MPFDRQFAEVLVTELNNAGFSTSLTNGELPNPLELTVSKSHRSLVILIYARRITAQSRSGDTPSNHGRPVGEMHTQMIFDSDQRGQRGTLFIHPEIKTVLFGFYEFAGDYTIAAYDTRFHQSYAYSKSLQVKFENIQRATSTGLTFQIRANGEVIVIFPITEIAQYLENIENFHQVSAELLSSLRTDEHISPQVKQIIEKDIVKNIPELTITERKQVITETVRYIRAYNFAQGIKKVYDRCAICGFQYDDILDAAHIVPVAAGGTDTYDNGLGLCPNCHRMFDKGIILVDENYKIYINERKLAAYQKIDRAGSINFLREHLRDFLYLPVERDYHPSPENLRRTYQSRR